MFSIRLDPAAADHPAGLSLNGVGRTEGTKIDVTNLSTDSDQAQTFVVILASEAWEMARVAPSWTNPRQLRFSGRSI